MIMAGILAVSLGTDFGYVMCAVTIAAAVYNAVVMSCYPDWTAKVRIALCLYITNGLMKNF